MSEKTPGSQSSDPWEVAKSMASDFISRITKQPDSQPSKRALDPWEQGRAAQGDIQPKAPVNPQRSKAENAMAQAVVLTPNEQARSNAYEMSDANINELKGEIAKTKDPKSKAILQTELDKLMKGKKDNSTQNEGDAIDTQRQAFEKLPKFSGKDFVDSPLQTKEGRTAFLEKVKKEYEDARKGKTAKELDKFKYLEYWVAEKYPKETAFFNYYRQNNIDGLTDSQKSYLGTHNKEMSFSNLSSNTRGFVYTDKADRIFLLEGGDINTAIHETEHLRQQQSMKEYGANSPEYRLGTLGNSNAPAQKLSKLVRENKDDPAFKEVWRASNSHGSSSEYLANFVAFMKTGIPEGKSWSDTAFFKKLVEKVGEKEATTMLLDTFAYVNRHPSAYAKYDKNKPTKAE